MKKITAFVLCFVMIFSFGACGKSKTPIEELTQNETLLYDALLIMSDSFFNPSEVRLLDVGDSGREKSTLTVTVRIQGETKGGGATNDYYKLYLDSLRGKAYATALAEDEFDSSDYYKENWDECKANEYPRSSYATFKDYRQNIVDSYLENDFFHTDEERDKAAEDDAKKRWDESSEDEYPRESYSSYSKYLSFYVEYYKDYTYVVKDYDKEKPNKRGAKFGTYEILETKTSITNSEEDKYDISKINKALKYYWDEKLGNN